MATTTTTHDPANPDGTPGIDLAKFARAVAATGTQGLVRLARVYLGSTAKRDSGDTAVLGLALAKLAFEAGELAMHNPTLNSAGTMPVFNVDEAGNAPALSLAHGLALARVWQTRQSTTSAARLTTTAAPRTTALAVQRASRTSYYAAAPRRTTEVSAMAAHPHTGPSSKSSGCASCGGSRHHTPAEPPVAESCSSCGGGAGGRCGCGGPAPTRTYDATQCPTLAISCETKERLRDCVKDALCDFARCLADTLCPDGRFDSDRLKDPTVRKDLTDCVGQLACSFLHCLPDALCPEECPPEPAPVDCLPCSYAVEVLR